jgi:serine O-acetyltransferase
MDEEQMMLISATEPDWEREKALPRRYEPAKYLLSTIRNYQRLKIKGGLKSRIVSPFLVLLHRFWSAVSGADIPLDSRIGGGLMIPHPNGIVIHPEADIGPNCLIFQQVTIGAGLKPGLPVIEGHVDIGAGAKIIGNIRIGAHARIGANAVVLHDVPSGATAIGIPAKIL